MISKPFIWKLRKFFEKERDDSHLIEYLNSEEYKKSLEEAKSKEEIAWKKYMDGKESREQALVSYKLSMTRGSALLHYVNGHITKEEYNNFLKGKINEP